LLSYEKLISCQDLEDDEDDDVSEGEPEDASEASGSEEEDKTPLKSGANKRKRNAGGSKATKKGKQPFAALKSATTPVSTPVGKFMKTAAAAGSSPATPGLSRCSPSIFGATAAKTNDSPAAASSPRITVTESTKKKLSMFGAPAAEPDQTGEGKVYGHTSLPFLKPENIRDKERRRPDDPDYNPRTLHVPDSFLRDQTPAQRQWWEFKADYYDVILFFKMGKFYEIFHMDADIAVAELNLVYMKGEVAHAGFPEVAYWRYASTLVEKGFKVARIEQTETPAMMEERLKSLGRNPTKFERVVEREVCQLSTKGTRINNYLDSETFEGDPR
jgi:DNA mismatch repair protein MSH6